MNISKTCTAYTHMLEHIKIHTKMLLIIMSNHAVNSESSDMKSFCLYYLLILILHLYCRLKQRKSINWYVDAN